MRKKSFARKKKKAKWREALLAVHADDYDNVYEDEVLQNHDGGFESDRLAEEDRVGEEARRDENDRKTVARREEGWP